MPIVLWSHVLTRSANIRANASQHRTSDQASSASGRQGTTKCCQRLGFVAIALCALFDRFRNGSSVLNLHVRPDFPPRKCPADKTAAAKSESIPPALLTRARTIALEHKELTNKLSDGFDTRLAKKLGEYSPIVNALGQWDKANEVSHIMATWQGDWLADLD